MFYSKSILSKKGPLGTIWLAAYFYKKLKKPQVSETDISSSIDRIIPDVQLSYRVLAQLLLGVVRIFSKKVDYLFNDCNEVLIRMGKSFVAIQWHTPKKATGTHHCKVFQPKDAIHENDQVVTPHEESIHVSVEAVSGADNGNAFTIPKNFELDLFDLEAPGEEEPATNREEHMLKVADEFNQPAFMGERHNASGFYLSGFTPMEEVMLPGLLYVDIEADAPQQVSGAGIQKNLQGDPSPLEDHGSHPSARRSLKFCTHSQGLEEKSVETNIQQAIGLSNSSPQKCPDVRTLVDDHGEMNLIHISEAASPQCAVTTPAIKERRWVYRKRKCLFDENVVLSNDTLRQWIHDSGSLVCKRKKAPHTFLDAWKAQRMSNVDSSLVDPLVPCIQLDFRTIFSESPPISSCQKKSACATQRSEPKKDDALAEQDQICRLIEKRCVELPSSASSARVPSVGRVEGDILKGPLTVEVPEAEFSFTDRDLSPSGENHRRDGWSTRTRSVARYFCHFFEQEEKGALSLFQILAGKQRTICAKLFYETLVLQSCGHASVEQETPYGDIIVNSMPAMRTVSELADNS